ncbi:MAG: TIM barrel protein [Verrucomicrobiota bacterium]|nr:TIM barrel protein [Verrucomicrobiota bacterium]
MKMGVCLEMFFTDRPFLDRIEAAGKAGYKFAEMWFTDMTAWKDGMRSNDPKDPAKTRAAAEKAGVVLTNAVIGSPDGGIGGGLTNPANRKQWLARANQTLEFCRAAGIGAAIVCSGNRVDGKTTRQTRKSVVTGLERTVKKAEKFGVDLLLEPLNDKTDHPGYFLTSSEEGAAICREIGSPRLRLLFDCYHMQIMEGDLCGHIRKNLDIIGHMHSGGHPGRHELWLGETNYPFLVKQIDAMGYSGVFALEYLPTLESAESLCRAAAYLETEKPQGCAPQ